MVKGLGYSGYRRVREIGFFNVGILVILFRWSCLINFVVSDLLTRDYSLGNVDFFSFVQMLFDSHLFCVTLNMLIHYCGVVV